MKVLAIALPLGDAVRGASRREGGQLLERLRQRLHSIFLSTRRYSRSLEMGAA